MSGPFFPPGSYRKTRGIHRIGDFADIPAISEVLKGTLFFAEDTGQLYRSNGTFWEFYSATPIIPNNIIRVGTRGAQPAANTVDSGTLYYVTDERIVERSDGVNWEVYDSILPAIDIPFDANNFTGNATGTTADWTVASGDVETLSYVLMGNVALLVYGINTSSVANNPSLLRIQFPLTARVTANDIGRQFNATSATATPINSVFVATTNLLLLRFLDGSAWPTGTNDTYVFGSAMVLL
jgi:hypothetical protein